MTGLRKELEVHTLITPFSYLGQQFLQGRSQQQMVLNGRQLVPTLPGMVYTKSQVFIR
jgi:hypothetical protein